MTIVEWLYKTDLVQEWTSQCCDKMWITWWELDAAAMIPICLNCLLRFKLVAASWNLEMKFVEISKNGRTYKHNNR